MHLGSVAGHGSEKLRVNPRKTWYFNLDRVTTNGDYEVTFHLKRPQPALLCAAGVGLVAGLSLPCAAAEMRRRPIGTGPFKFVEFKPNEWSRRPATRITGSRDGLISTASNGTIIKDVRPRNLTFIAGKFDILRLTARRCHC